MSKSELKTKTNDGCVEDFLNTISDEQKRRDSLGLLEMFQKVTGEKPKMWGPSIIGFGSYHYAYNSGREGDMPVIAFSPRKAATVLYGFSNAESLLPKLGKHTRGKGCLYIKKLADVDQKVLEAMAVKSVATSRAK